MLVRDIHFGIHLLLGICSYLVILLNWIRTDVINHFVILIGRKNKEQQRERSQGSNRRDDDSRERNRRRSRSRRRSQSSGRRRDRSRSSHKESPRKSESRDRSYRRRSRNTTRWSDSNVSKRKPTEDGVLSRKPTEDNVVSRKPTENVQKQDDSSKSISTSPQSVTKTNQKDNSNTKERPKSLESFSSTTKSDEQKGTKLTTVTNICAETLEFLRSQYQIRENLKKSITNVAQQIKANTGGTTDSDPVKMEKVKSLDDNSNVQGSTKILTLLRDELKAMRHSQEELINDVTFCSSKISDFENSLVDIKNMMREFEKFFCQIETSENMRKSIRVNGVLSNLYINEDLTLHNKIIFKETRDFAKTNGLGQEC
ncbi:hypothetical protein JTB14_027105 [Gonioctena quinquepunctata]|nr:hypothetical protein JTB14_027105 [Gonioctena quinquepunctata]